MAAASDAIWAIDLGNNSLKALHLVAVGDVVQVIGFDHVPHGKILSSSGVGAAEREELVAVSLRQFVQRNDLGFDPIIISAPSQNSFARFVTLPPVEAKRLPEIVRFEAAQQIPFDMSEVQWDYQLLSDPDSPEKKVGLFAIKNDVVGAVMEPFDREELSVSYVQMASMALYNYLLFDRPDLANSDKRATVVVNIGADSTDLVVCTASGVWQRCIMMGGNAFTNAIASTFKLSFEKAEKLKRTAPVSKYARQIFQAMRPVFTDLASEVQRSLGFYTSSNPDVKLTRVIAMGGGTRLRGLVKYLQQTLQIPVEKPESFKRLAISPGVSAAKFHENVGDFAVVYGLGLQGLGMARIESNLLPSTVARSMAWAGKMKYFIGAALMMLAVSLLCLGRVGLDRVSYAKSDDTRARAKRVVAEAEKAVTQNSGVKGQTDEFFASMKKHFSVFQYREMIPELYQLILSASPNAKTNPKDRALYDAYERGDVAAIMQIPRPERKQLFLTTLSMYYSDDLATAQFQQTATMRKTQRLQDAEAGGGYEEMDYESIYGPDFMRMNLGGASGTKTSGFTVVIEGYSPYKEIGDLLDPPNVKEYPGRWGLVTRLENLKQFLNLDVNAPFEIYQKANADQYKLETGPVDLEAEYLPSGVGVLTSLSRQSGDIGIDEMIVDDKSLTLLDPVTKETICAETELDQFGKPRLDALRKPKKLYRDYWFKLQFKLKWNGAPPTPEGVGDKDKKTRRR
ncbi:MAG TPA: type IV pilus assembly protein PilM [Sedimentisphaerales bacterium]|jgi:type IV pilus assembly protein PilM|nr:type IV pilus assembly protein PilM [Sedimentisphaerales bacterium]HNU28244.1 type IV pilus assembly protein PilM [Sedimentisphaerales bacterium]